MPRDAASAGGAALFHAVGGLAGRAGLGRQFSRVGAVDDPPRDLLVEALAAERRQIVPPAGGALLRIVAKRSQAALAGEGERRAELGIDAGWRAPAQGLVDQAGGDALGAQLGGDRPRRGAAPLQGPGPQLCVAAVVEQAELLQAVEYAFDRRLPGVEVDLHPARGEALQPGAQQPAQMGARGGIAREMAQRRRLQGRGVVRRSVAAAHGVSRGRPAEATCLPARGAPVMSGAMTITSLPLHPPRPRRIGAVNWRGLWTLYLKEVRRFLNVFTQTVLAPVVTTLLFLAVFSLALGGALREVQGLPFVAFLAPGLVMMAMLQNAFANTSSSLVIAKVQGNIVDILMPPLSPAELAIAIAAGGVTRGLLVGVVVTCAMWIFVPVAIHSWLAVLFFAVAASLMLSLLGMIGGIWSEKFDHIAAVTNFVITPLSFLSGTFYSIERLPPLWQDVAHWNPFFYLIDGFRYGFIGRADAPLAQGMLVSAAIDAALLFVAYRMVATGYRLKA